MSTASLWIFGYGSLVWRPDFVHDRREPATIDGWVRRFWQASPDHRGVPEQPGRVVTLVPASEVSASHPSGPGAHAREPEADGREAPCWGMAYRVRPADQERVLAELDHRERAGYERVETEITLSPSGGAPRRVGGLVYVAAATNPNYLGPTPVHAIAERVLEATGPSGPNREYVHELAASLRAMRATDPHVFAVEAALAKLRAEFCA